MSNVKRSWSPVDCVPEERVSWCADVSSVSADLVGWTFGATRSKCTERPSGPSAAASALSIK